VIELLASSPLLTIMLVMALGAVVGTIPFGPLRFGAAGALFVGLAVGALDPALGEGLGLVQTLGLALFVYTVGVAAGETFFSDLRGQLPLMVLGTAVLAVVAGAAVGVGRVLGLDTPLVAGAFAGALTSTPALAAATSATGSPDAAVGYSLGYPIGVTLAIAAVAVVVGRSWPGAKDPAPAANEGLQARSVLVERAATVREVPGWSVQELRMSYLIRDGRTRVVAPGEHLHEGDKVLLVGAPSVVDEAASFLGRELEQDLTDDRQAVDFRRFITRVLRGDSDLLAKDDLVLQPGDRVLAVVPRSELHHVGTFFGDSERKVSEVDALALGLGIALGLLIGLVTIPLPGGIQFALGPAAGPLVVGMVLGAVHRSGPITWDLPLAANLTIRQLGLLLFLATVGLASGSAFGAQAFTATGLRVGVLSAVLVLAAAALFLAGSRALGLSAPRGAGGLAGLVGQPAILAYATSRVSDERIEAGYAALFALGIIVKILLVQVIAVL